jgi:outer membrane protein OmpA-like peptidoglycan-associated protein
MKLRLTVFLNLILISLIGYSQPIDTTHVLVENLGDHVNSEYEESGPVISYDEKTLYFFRKGHPENLRGTADIWYCVHVNDSTWSPAIRMGAPINDLGENSVHAISPDGNTLLLHNQYLPNGTAGNGVSLSTRKDDKWQFPKKLNIKNYKNKVTCSFDMDDKEEVLISAIQQEKTVGKQDLYVSFKDKKTGIWSEPKNLGSNINTPEVEATAFLTADGTELYFSSNGHGGEGGFDIFVSKRLDSTWTRWSTPENMGVPYNSPGNELYFSIPASGKYLYLARDHGTLGGSDLFRIKLKKQPLPVLLLRAMVTDAKTGKPVEAEIYFEKVEDTEVHEGKKTDNKGNFEVVLKGGKKYKMFIKAAPNYVTEHRFIDLSDLKAYKEDYMEIKLQPVEVGLTVKIENIYFDFGKSEILPESFDELNALVETLKDAPKAKIEISGHTDAIGKDEDNLKLSQDRANSVVTYLVQHGIFPDRLVAVGYGETVPVATNDTDEGRALNRRVEFKILKVDQTKK